MRCKYFTFYLGVLFLFFVSNAHAIQIQVNLSDSNVSFGNNVSADIYISDLGGVDIGAFDFTLSFDDSLFAVNSVSFGTDLDVLGLGSISSYSDSGTGELNMYEISLDTVGDLNSLQTEAFSLGTISFGTIGVGLGELSLVVNDLGDAYGNPLYATTINALYEISTTAVPEPNILLLFLVGLMVIFFLGNFFKLSENSPPIAQLEYAHFE